MASVLSAALAPAFLLAVLAPLPAATQNSAADPGLSEVGGTPGMVRLAAVGATGEGAGGRLSERVRSWAPGLTLALGGGGSVAPAPAKALALPSGGQPVETRIGAVHVFAVGEISGTQAHWLRAALAASRAPWKLVYLPEPPFSSAAPEPGRAARWPLREWGADAVLSGGEGHYERLRAQGMAYFVNGAGRTARPVEGRAEGSQCLFDEGLGALLVEADRERLEFRFVTAEGLVVDSHSLRKQAYAGLGEAASAPAVPVSASP